MRNFILIGLMLLPLFTIAQIQVTNIDGEPIDGVYIYSADKQFQTYTDSLGAFNLTDTILVDSLYFKMLGYNSKVLSVKQLTKIVLEESSYELPEFEVNYVKRKKIWINKFKKPVKNRNVFFLTGDTSAKRARGRKYYQFINNSDLANNALIKQLKIHSLKATTELHITFFNQKDGFRSKQINNEEIVFTLTKKGWNTINLEKYNIVIPKGGVFLEFEMYNTSYLKISPPISGYWVTKYNKYPIYYKYEEKDINVYHNRNHESVLFENKWGPKVNFSTLKPHINSAIQLLIETDKESFIAIKNSQKHKELSDRKKAKLFAKKVKRLTPKRDTVNYPNRTPIQVLEAMGKMKKNTDAVAQVFFYLYKVNEDRFELDVDLLAKNELKMNIPYRTLEKAKQKILNTPEYLNATESFTIEVEYMTGLMPLTFTKTNNGWVFDERYD